MQRNSYLQNKKRSFDSLLTEKESLLFRLCEQLHLSGFVFEDSSETEIEAGGKVINEFVDRQDDMLRQLVPMERLNGFTEYLKQFEWSAEQLKTKLCQRITKVFDQMAMGTHHHYNVHYNISQGLRHQKGHPLYDLLMYIEAYYMLVLGGEKPKPDEAEETTDYSKSNFMVEDLMQLRNQILERLEGRAFVNSFLRHIAKSRGVLVETLVPAEHKESNSYSVNNSNSVGIPTTEKQNTAVREATEVFKKTSNEEEQVLIKSTDSDISENSDAAVEDDEFDIENESRMLPTDSDETDVVFGSANINISSMEKFVLKYPDSALKFLMRLNTDGKPLSADVVSVHASWEERGLSRNQLKKYVLKLMEWSVFPKLEIQNLYLKLRDRVYEVSRGK